jgi:hypothetical protein
VQIKPHHKAMMDVLLDGQRRKRSRRAWLVWLTILVLSLLALYLFNHDIVSGAIGSALAIAGVVGIFGFLIFLSTKPFGRSDSSFRWWWM